MGCETEEKPVEAADGFDGFRKEATAELQILKNENAGALKDEAPTTADAAGKVRKSFAGRNTGPMFECLRDLYKKLAPADKHKTEFEKKFWDQLSPRYRAGDRNAELENEATSFLKDQGWI